MSGDQYKFQMAIQDFQSARQRAAIQEVLARVRGKSNQLLSYEDVAEKLKLRARTERGVQQVPLDAIVGSVGRNTDLRAASCRAERKIGNAGQMSRLPFSRGTYRLLRSTK